MVGDEGGQQAAGEFHEGVAFADGGLAGGAAAFEEQVAEDRDVFAGADFVVAVGAGGVGEDQVVAFWLLFGWEVEDFSGLVAPVAIKHDREAVDDDVEEAADQEAEEQGTEGEGQGGTGQEFG